MKKTKKALLAVLACSALFVGAFGLAACDGLGNGGPGGEPQHHHRYEGTPNGNGTHNATCKNTEGTCDTPTVTNGTCDTDGEGGVCSVCGYKEGDEDDTERKATVSVGVDKTLDSLDETGLTLTLDGAEDGKSYTLSSTNDKVEFQTELKHGNPITFEYKPKLTGTVIVKSINGTLSDVTIKLEEAEEEKEFTTIAVNDEVTVTGADYDAPKKYEIQLAAGKYQMFVVGETGDVVKALDSAAPFGIGAGYGEDGSLIPLVTMTGDQNTVEVDEGKYYIEAYEDVTFKVAVASVHAHVWKWEVTEQPTADETGSATKVECLGTVGTCDWVADGSSVELPTLDSERYFVGDDSASCLTAGTQKYSIMIDDNEVSFYVETPILDHTVQVLKGKEATCTETGLTAGKKCSICHTVIEEQEVIPAKGHTFDTAAPIVNETAKTVSQRCTVCNKSVVYEYDNLLNNPASTNVRYAGSETISTGVTYIAQNNAKNFFAYTFTSEDTYSVYFKNLKGGNIIIGSLNLGSKSTENIISSNNVQTSHAAFAAEGFAVEGYYNGTSEYKYYVTDESGNRVKDEKNEDVKATANTGDYVRLVKNSFINYSLSGFDIVKVSFHAAANTTFKINMNDASACYLIGIDEEPTILAELCSIGEGNVKLNDSELEFVPVTEESAGTYTFTAENGKFAVYVNGELCSDDAKDYFGYVAFSYRYLTVNVKAGDVVKVVKVAGKASENIVNIKKGAVDEPAAPEYNTLEAGNNTITLTDTNISTGKYEDGTEKFYTFTASESGYYEISVADDVTVGATIKEDREHYSTIFDVSATGKHSGVFYAEAGETIFIAFVGNGSLEFVVNIAVGEEPITYLNVGESINVTFSGFDTIVKLTVGNSVAEGTYTIGFEVPNGMLRSHLYFSVNNGIVVEDKYNPNGVASFITADIAAGANHTVGAGTRSSGTEGGNLTEEEYNARMALDFTRTVTLKAGDVIYLATDSLTSGYANITLTPVSE